MAEEPTCAKCDKKVDPATLTKCPICYRMVCEDCRYHVSGRYFCSSPCAQFYFFEDEEF